MSRTLVLTLALALTLTASAAIPLAPLPPRILPLPNAPQLNPAAATNGRTTLVAWTYAYSPYVQAHTLHARLLGVHDAAINLGSGMSPQIATNGEEYLIAYSTGQSRFLWYPVPNVAVTLMRDDGTIATRRMIHDAIFARVHGATWSGTEWVVAFVADGNGFVMTLDRDLNPARKIALGPALRVGLTTIEGRVWAVHQRTEDTEVFPIDDLATRFRLAGAARMAGHIAVLGDLSRVALLDPHTGFSEPRPILATSDVPLQITLATPWKGGALFVFYGLNTLMLVTVDANGFRQEYTAALTDYTIQGGAAVAGTTLFAAAPWPDFQRAQVFAFPLEPWPTQPFTLDPTALVSIGNVAYQDAPVLASNGTTALAFWNQTIDDELHRATFMRSIDADGVPFGPVTQLPFTISQDADAIFDDRGFVVTWSASNAIYASANGGAPQLIGYGKAPAIARGFIVWCAADAVITGTPLRDDATPVVPGGFELLPSLPLSQGAPDIAPIAGGYRIVFDTFQNVMRVDVTAAGTVVDSEVIGDRPATPMIGGSLIAFSGRLIPNGAAPVDIHGSLITYVDRQSLYTVDVNGLTRLLLHDNTGAVTVVGDMPIVVYREGPLLVVASYPVKRRAVR
jgi:hypothetical protein